MSLFQEVYSLIFLAEYNRNGYSGVAPDGQSCFYNLNTVIYLEKFSLSVIFLKKKNRMVPRADQKKPNPEGEISTSWLTYALPDRSLEVVVASLGTRVYFFVLVEVGDAYNWYLCTCLLVIPFGLEVVVASLGTRVYFFVLVEVGDAYNWYLCTCLLLIPFGKERCRARLMIIFFFYREDVGRLTTIARESKLSVMI